MTTTSSLLSKISRPPSSEKNFMLVAENPNQEKFVSPSAQRPPSS